MRFQISLKIKDSHNNHHITIFLIKKYLLDLKYKIYLLEQRLPEKSG